MIGSLIQISHTCDCQQFPVKLLSVAEFCDLTVIGTNCLHLHPYTHSIINAELARRRTGGEVRRTSSGCGSILRRPSSFSCPMAWCLALLIRATMSALLALNCFRNMLIFILLLASSSNTCRRQHGCHSSSLGNSKRKLFPNNQCC